MNLKRFSFVAYTTDLEDLFDPQLSSFNTQDTPLARARGFSRSHELNGCRSGVDDAVGSREAREQGAHQQYFGFIISLSRKGLELLPPPLRRIARTTDAEGALATESPTDRQPLFILLLPIEQPTQEEDPMRRSVPTIHLFFKSLFALFLLFFLFHNYTFH